VQLKARIAHEFQLPITPARLRLLAQLAASDGGGDRELGDLRLAADLGVAHGAKLVARARRG